MFCFNCGKEIPDNSNVCIYCGHKLSDNEVKADCSDTETKAEVKTDNDAKIEVEANTEFEANTEVEAKTEVNVTPVNTPSPVANQTTNSMPTNSMPANNMTADNESDKPKKKKGGVVIAIIIILLLLALAGCGAGAYFILNSADYKIKKAVETSDITAVCDLYSSVKSDDIKKYVQDSMYNYACELETKFVDEEMDYDTALKEWDMLGKEILKKDKEFKVLLEDVDALNTSRDNFKAAEKAFKNEEYEKAMELYALVIVDDKNYKKAQTKITECEEALIIDVSGKYVVEIDFGSILVDRLGFGDFDYTINYPLYFMIEFDGEGSGILHFDNDKMDAMYDTAIDDIVNMVNSYMKDEFGYSNAMIADFYEYEGYDDPRQWVIDNSKIDEMLDSYKKAEYNFSYEVIDENTISIWDSAKRPYNLYYYMDGDDMVITGDDDDFVKMALLLLGESLPMTFERED